MIHLMDGGAWMVIKPDVVYDAFKSIKKTKIQKQNIFAKR
jgi:tRNA G37 N-methylase TrmD